MIDGRSTSSSDFGRCGHDILNDSTIQCGVEVGLCLRVRIGIGSQRDNDTTIPYRDWCSGVYMR